jgi:hypothetical protein
MLPRPSFRKIGKSIKSIGAYSAIIFGINQAPAFAAADDATSAAIANVLRVQYSLKNVDETIEGGSDVNLVLSQIQSLMKNYKLRDNLQIALNAVPDNKKAEAREHSRTVIEDLSLVSEYYTEDIDNMSGRKVIPRQVLSLAQSATKATEAEMDEFFKLIPGEVFQPLKAQVADEFKPIATATTATD